MERRVVITGMGAITPIGNSVQDFWEGIKEGKCGIDTITKFDTTDFKVKLAAEVKGFNPEEYFDKKVLSVNKQITQRNNRVKFEFSDTKTRDSRRIVPITKVLLNDLKMLYEQDKKDYYGFNDDFFVVSDAKPIADSNIYLRRTKLATLAGLKVIRIHDFRHSCASLLINNGANVTLVAKYLGHTKIEETLNTYSHMFSTALDSVVSVIDSLEDD